MDEVRAKCGNDENMGRLYKQSGFTSSYPRNQIHHRGIQPLNCLDFLRNAAEAKADTKAKYLGLAEGQELVESVVIRRQWSKRK